MMRPTSLGGSFTFGKTSLTVNRMGYGAMQLAGPGVWGPPKDPDGAVAVLREAVAAGVNHIDTADYYGPHVTNQIVRQALHPYPAGLVIVTKLGGRRPPDKSWQPAISPQELTAGVHDNLRNLGLDVLDIVNYRVMGAGHGPEEGSIAEQVTVLADLQRKGLIRHIGLSNVTASQVAEAQAITDIVCVQNLYNVAHRDDDTLHRRAWTTGHRLRAILSAGRIRPAAVRCARRGRSVHEGETDAGRAGMAASPRAKHPADSRYIVDPPSTRESRGGGAATLSRNDR